MTTTATGPSTPVRSPVARRIAVAALVAWGLVHVLGGVVLVAAAAGDPDAALRTLATGLEPGVVTGDTTAAVAGLVGLQGFTVAIAGVVVAVGGWRGRVGPSASLTMPIAVATAADLALLLFLVGPGVMAPVDATPGIALLAAGGVAAWRDGWRARTRAA